MALLLNGVSGPDFASGDLTLLTIDGSELSMRLLNIPHNDGVIDRIAHEGVIDSVLGEDWYAGADDRAMRDLVTQSWKYMDDVTNVHMATCFFEVKLIENLPEEVDREICLSFKKFKASILEDLGKEGFDPRLDSVEEWPRVENDFLAKIHERPLIDWLQVQLELDAGSKPFPVLVIPVSQKFVISASLMVQPFNYDDVEARFSQEQIREFMFSIFDEFVDNVSVTYSPEFCGLLEHP